MREQEVARAQARSKGTKIAVLVVVGIVAVFALVFIAARFSGSDDPDTLVGADTPLATATDGTEATADTLTNDSTPAANATADTATGVGAGEATGDTASDGSTATATAECPPAGGTEGQTQEFSGPPPMCLDPDVTYSAKVTTTVGEFTIDLDQDQAPVTVNSFVFLARNHYFDDTVCHRVIKDFVAQCGDPTATGSGGPGYEFGDELPEAGAYSVGSIAMANSGPDTNGSQFFVITGPQGASLSPDYSLFGQVPETDLGVVEKMNALGSDDESGQSSEELKILSVEIVEG